MPEVAARKSKSRRRVGWKADLNKRVIQLKRQLALAQFDFDHGVTVPRRGNQTGQNPTPLDVFEDDPMQFVKARIGIVELQRKMRAIRRAEGDKVLAWQRAQWGIPQDIIQRKQLERLKRVAPEEFNEAHIPAYRRILVLARVMKRVKAGAQYLLGHPLYRHRWFPNMMDGFTGDSNPDELLLHIMGYLIEQTPECSVEREAQAALLTLGSRKQFVHYWMHERERRVSSGVCEYSDTLPFHQHRMREEFLAASRCNADRAFNFPETLEKKRAQLLPDIRPRSVYMATAAVRRWADAAARSRELTEEIGKGAQLGLVDKIGFDPDRDLLVVEPTSIGEKPALLVRMDYVRARPSGRLDPLSRVHHWSSNLPVFAGKPGMGELVDDLNDIITTNRHGLRDWAIKVMTGTLYMTDRVRINRATVVPVEKTTPA